ncbi:hypothetical protein F5B22DRAFT_211753 [Xylaria bambusicola]|uniref:uncharacterized protein n=1 Tax=Xylaria bambusicola TaxID=326684 RepID=UPI0020089873|nr:uncharacterized protein F5B22DRAFT_211753 [Xylaria bambusicola]KAI0514988.1 hypothetical protein F5B22DRAFT_211753 [Xylaria bambusicola]
MTTAGPLVYYPQYCFHLSPTINAWCPLRAIDIAGLVSRAGFEDINVFFCLNHPIQWVRIVGVVVAIDHYYGHQVYTVDDSTGQCIECTLRVPVTKNGQINRRDTTEAKASEPTTLASKTLNAANTAETRTINAVSVAPLPMDVDIGMVLEIKGSVKEFRGQKQIQIHTAKEVLSTTQEVLFWDKIREFRRNKLSQPWVLKDREIRRCRKLQQSEAPELDEKRKKKKAVIYADGPEEGGTGKTHAPRNSVGGTSVKAAKAARVESLSARIGNKDKYDALGL